MSDLAHTPLRLVAFVIALITIVPTAGIILRHMLTLQEPSASRLTRTLDIVWAVVPLATLMALLIAAGLA